MRLNRSEVLKLHAAGAGVTKIAAHLTAGGLKVSPETVRRFAAGKRPGGQLTLAWATPIRGKFMQVASKG